MAIATHATGGSTGRNTSFEHTLRMIGQRWNVAVGSILRLEPCGGSASGSGTLSAATTTHATFVQVMSEPMKPIRVQRPARQSVIKLRRRSAHDQLRFASRIDRWHQHVLATVHYFCGAQHQ